MTIHQFILLVLSTLTGLCLWGLTNRLAVLKKLKPYDLAQKIISSGEINYSYRQVEKALKKNLFIIRFTSACAPFIGLVGTIEGIAAGISALGLQGVAAVTGPISEALLLTGLAVAVATLAFAINQYLSLRIDQALEDIGAIIEDESNKSIEPNL